MQLLLLFFKLLPGRRKLLLPMLQLLLSYCKLGKPRIQLRFRCSQLYFLFRKLTVRLCKLGCGSIQLRFPVLQLGIARIQLTLRSVQGCLLCI